MEELKRQPQPAGNKLKLLSIAAAVLVTLLLLLTWSSGKVSADTESQILRAVEQIDGVGRADAVVTYSDAEAGSVAGVVVVCEGAGNVGVKLRVLRAVVALTGVGSESVEIFEMKEAGK